MPSLALIKGNHKIRNVLLAQCVRCTEIIASIADIGNFQMYAWTLKKERGIFLAGDDTANRAAVS
jgi:hypothetical protein